MTTAVIEITSYTLQIIFFMSSIDVMQNYTLQIIFISSINIMIISVLRNTAAHQAVNSCMNA